MIIGLKTAKGTKQLKLDPAIYDALQARGAGVGGRLELGVRLTPVHRPQKERVAVGDVIYIEANSGSVKRVGRCDAYATEYDLEARRRGRLGGSARESAHARAAQAEEYVPLPRGEVHKSKEVVQVSV